LLQVPTGQDEQVLLSPRLKVPLAQTTGARLGSRHWCPGGQGAQVAAPDASANDPSAQGVQLDESAEVAVPGSHNTGFALRAGHLLPAGHDSHPVAPPRLYVPRSHWTGRVVHPPAQDDPAGQDIQGWLSSRPGRYQPAAQGEEGQKLEGAAETLRTPLLPLLYWSRWRSAGRSSSRDSTGWARRSRCRCCSEGRHPAPSAPAARASAAAALIFNSRRRRAAGELRAVEWGRVQASARSGNGRKGRGAQAQGHSGAVAPARAEYKGGAPE